MRVKISLTIKGDWGRYSCTRSPIRYWIANEYLIA